MVKHRTPAMSGERLARGLIALGYTVSTGETLLGVARRSLYRMCQGQAPVPVNVAKLLDMYERHGVPEEHQS